MEKPGDYIISLSDHGSFPFLSSWWGF